MPCLAYRRAAVRNAGSPVKPATDASHACGDSRFSTAEWGKFAVDSPLEGDGFEPSVPVKGKLNHASFMFDRYRRPSAGIRNPRGPTAGGSDSSGYG
jgi:hypothetical protein